MDDPGNLEEGMDNLSELEQMISAGHAALDAKEAAEEQDRRERERKAVEEADLARAVATRLALELLPQAVHPWIDMGRSASNPTGRPEGWLKISLKAPECQPVWLTLNLRGRVIHKGQYTVIPADGYYIAEGDQDWGQEYEGSVTLVDAEGAKVDETHSMSDDGDGDFTYGRYPNGLDTDQRSDWKLMKATPRAENVLS